MIATVNIARLMAESTRITSKLIEERDAALAERDILQTQVDITKSNYQAVLRERDIAQTLADSRLAEIERLVVQLVTLSVAARRTARGCDCEYDHRCGRCAAIIDLHELLAPASKPRCPSNECQIRRQCTGHAGCTSEHRRVQP